MELEEVVVESTEPSRPRFDLRDPGFLLLDLASDLLLSPVRPFLSQGHLQAGIPRIRELEAEFQQMSVDYIDLTWPNGITALWVCQAPSVFPRLPSTQRIRFRSCVDPGSERFA